MIGPWRVALSELRPPEQLAPSAWAEAHVMIPPDAALPGRLRMDNAPHMTEPIDCIADPDVRKVTLQWGAQLGKTQVLLCAMAYYIVHEPQSQVLMQPTQGDMAQFLETKFRGMCDASPTIGSRLAIPRGRDGVNNQSLKSYPGGYLYTAWSGAPRTMRSKSAPKIYCDEVDGYDVTAEGHPVALLEQRSVTYGDRRLLFQTSTPTIRGASHIETAFLAGDRRRRWVPCPHCGEFQLLTWERLVWDEYDGRPILESVLYRCAHCGAGIDDAARAEMLRAGVWRAERPFQGHASFHLSALYSTFVKWRDIVIGYFDAKARDDLQTFTNVWLAETYEEVVERATADAFASRAEPAWERLPVGCLALTAGVDMQVDRLEVEIVAWGVGEESWSVSYHVLWGDTLSLEVWEQLDELLGGSWETDDARTLTIAATGVDTGGTGGHTQAAYDYVATRRAKRRLALKGVAGWGRPILGQPSRKKSGRRARRVDLYPVAVDEAKLIIARRMGLSAPSPGYMHTPDSREAEWYEQMAAEKLVLSYRAGAPVRRWVQQRPRNEALDCRVYSYAALRWAGLDLGRLARAAEKRREGATEEQREAWARRVVETSARLEAAAADQEDGDEPQAAPRPAAPAPKKRGTWSAPRRR